MSGGRAHKLSLTSAVTVYARLLVSSVTLALCHGEEEDGRDRSGYGSYTAQISGPSKERIEMCWIHLLYLLRLQKTNTCRNDKASHTLQVRLALQSSNAHSLLPRIRRSIH